LTETRKLTAQGPSQRSDRPAIAAHHGRIVQRAGDGRIIEFSSVVNAVRRAIEVQNGLMERNARVSEDQRIQFPSGGPFPARATPWRPPL
jgi:class 3 adenylate cyclase